MADDGKKERKKEHKKDHKKDKTPRGGDATASTSASVSAAEARENAPANPAIRKQASECAVKFVTVFSDRAEVTRHVSAQLQAGTTDIVIEGVTNKIDKDTVRISGGTGAATLLEVSYATRFHHDPPPPSTEADVKKKEREELVAERTKLQDQQAVLEQEKKFLEELVDSMLSPPSSSSKKSSSSSSSTADAAPDAKVLMSAPALDNVAQFLDFYRKQLEVFDQRGDELQQQIKKLDERIAQLTETLRAMGSGSHTQHESREITISMHAAAATTLELALTYLVRDARWTPSYDVRVVGNDPTVQLTYQGTVVNDSAEEWRDVTVSLSSASPAVYGTPPELPKVRVEFHDGYSGQAWSAASSYQSSAGELSGGGAPGGGSGGGGGGGGSPAATSVDSASQHATSASFTIQRKATIPSDNRPHKVTVAILELHDAQFSFFAVPRLNAAAFLKAKVTNTSDYQLLAGECKVFFDGSYVTTSSIKDASPKESFEVSLGQDAGIKVEYENLSKARESSGIINRTHTRNMKFRTKITNTKTRPIEIRVEDHWPVSGDPKQVTITLVDPDPKVVGVVGGETKDEKTLPAGPDSAVVVNRSKRTQNLEWRVRLAPGQTQTILLHWSITWPANETLTGFPGLY